MPIKSAKPVDSLGEMGLKCPAPPLFAPLAHYNPEYHPSLLSWNSTKVFHDFVELEPPSGHLKGGHPKQDSSFYKGARKVNLSSSFGKIYRKSRVLHCFGSVNTGGGRFMRVVSARLRGTMLTFLTSGISKCVPTRCLKRSKENSTLH